MQERLALRGASIGAEPLRRRADGTWPERPEVVTGGDLASYVIASRVPLAAVHRAARSAPGL